MAPGGFALIITLSLMILLVVVAVGLLTLSTIGLRSTSQASEMAIARANSRVALMLAIGDLQKYSGSDTRITARADILDANNPPVTGVWKSWEGTDHEQGGGAKGRPVSPGNYKSKKTERFLGWLTSAGDRAIPSKLPDTAKGSGKVVLVGDATVGKEPDRQKLQIHLKPTQVNFGGQAGACAWWVSGENQKARLPRPYEPSSDKHGQWAVNAKSHSVADPEVFGMEDLLTDASPSVKAVSLKQSDLISNAATIPASREFFHDLSTSSLGLLTNVATGGWKKDLSLMTENWSNLGSGSLPFFRLKPGEDFSGSVPTLSSPTASGSMLYPWAQYRGGGSEIAIYQQGAVSSWENLKDYALAYKRMSTSVSSGRCTMAPWSIPNSETSSQGVYNFLHKVRVLPVIARLQWVFSHAAGIPVPAVGDPPIPPGSLEPRLLLTPVLTMWNPYNVELSASPQLTFTVSKPLPVGLKYTVNGVAYTACNSLITGNVNNSPSLSTTFNLRYDIAAGLALKPGETRVFSPAVNQLSSADADVIVRLEPGYRSKGGHYFAVKGNDGKKVRAPASATIKAEARFDTQYEDNGAYGVGVFLDMNTPAGRQLAYRMTYSPSVALEVYKPLSGLAESGPLSVVFSNPSPFMTTVFGARMASRTHIAAKGFVQSSPLVNYTTMGGKDFVDLGRHYGGTNHPVNSPFDFSFLAVAGAGDSQLPNESDGTNRGYIVTGFTKADGLSRCVVAELPTRPLQSIAELQNWDLRYDNPVPPFAFNLIGNSDATPLLPSNAVVNSQDSGLGANLQHDDSYCANHVLFDDWFFSSIAPDPTTFGTGGRNLKTTFTEFVAGKAPLGNRAYQPIAADSGRAAGETSKAEGVYTDHVNKSDSWKTIASRLEVEGMFNVNSTSVKAWRALLGHARDQKVPYIKDSGGAWSVDLSDSVDHAFSRFSVAGDVEAKSQGSSGAFPESAEFSGYRILDEDLLDALSEEVVKQIRLRGPFLSLSEFINRQLSSGDLALAGTIQAALNKLAEKNATNFYAGITDVISRPSSSNPLLAGSAEYRFPDAAVGQATYGLPGWTRQADVLRPLAPILTARDDTFTIRAYGDARDRSGNITARATCEATVRRCRDYVDPSDQPDSIRNPSSTTNQSFGRKYEIVSFHWLADSEL